MQDTTLGIVEDIFKKYLRHSSMLKSAKIKDEGKDTRFAKT